jgi:hypothetical protein
MARSMSGHDVIGLGEVHGAAIEGADFGQAFGDVGHSLGGAGHIDTLVLQRQRCLGGAEYQIAAHAGGQVDHHVGVGGTDAIDDRAVILRIARRGAGVRIAHVAMHHGGASTGGVEGAVGDVVRASAGRGAIDPECRQSR